MWCSKAVPILLALSVVVVSCSDSRRSNLLVQVCVNSHEEVDSLVNFAKIVAIDSGANFTDRSAQSLEELKQIKSNAIRSNKRLVNVSVRTNNYDGFSIGNLGVPDNQIIIGFSGENESTSSIAMREKILQYVEKRWKYIILPDGVGGGILKC